MKAMCGEYAGAQIQSNTSQIVDAADRYDDDSAPKSSEGLKHISSCCDELKAQCQAAMDDFSRLKGRLGSVPI